MSRDLQVKRLILYIITSFIDFIRNIFMLIKPDLQTLILSIEFEREYSVHKHQPHLRPGAAHF